MKIDTYQALAHACDSTPSSRSAIYLNLLSMMQSFAVERHELGHYFSFHVSPKCHGCRDQKGARRREKDVHR